MTKAGRFPCVTICGSMRYFDEMIEAARFYTTAGYIVLMPFVHIAPADQNESEVKRMLDRMHFEKIDMSELVVIVGQHRGMSTMREINYAIDTDTTIVSWKPDA